MESVAEYERFGCDRLGVPCPPLAFPDYFRDFALSYSLAGALLAVGGFSLYQRKKPSQNLVLIPGSLAGTAVMISFIAYYYYFSIFKEMGGPLSIFVR